MFVGKVGHQEWVVANDNVTTVNFAPFVDTVYCLHEYEQPSASAAGPIRLFLIVVPLVSFVPFLLHRLPIL